MASVRSNTQRSLSFSEISTALSCWAQWDFKYGGRLAGTTLSSKSIAPQLSGGRAWGAMVATYHQGAGSLLASFDAMDAMRASLNADQEKMAAQGVIIPGVLDQRMELEAHLSEVFAHYATLVPSPTRLTCLEREIEVPIPSRSGSGRGSSVYKFQCFLDAMEDADGVGEWLWEFKLRGRLTKRWLIELGRQYRWYAWARQRQTGRQVVGIKIVERLNDFPHAPKIVRDGKEIPEIYECPRCNASPGQPCEGPHGPLLRWHRDRSALAQMVFRPSHDADQLTTPELYMAACHDWKAKPRPETVEALRGRQWQQVVSIPFRPSELREAGRELVSAARLIRDLDNGTLYPVRNAKGGNCGFCDFRSICANPMDELYVEQLFRRSIPKRERNAHKEVSV